MSTLDEWTDAVCLELGLDPAVVDRSLVLDLARDVAHGVARPAAPLTTFLMGLAAGRDGATLEAVRAADASVRVLLPEPAPESAADSAPES